MPLFYHFCITLSNFGPTFQKWPCFLDSLIWNTWTLFGGVPSTHRCNKTQYWMCFKHVNCHSIVSMSNTLLPGSACWALSWLCSPPVDLEYFSLQKLRWWHFTSEGFCLGFFNAWEAMRCWSAASCGETTWQGLKPVGGWNEVVCNKDGKTPGPVLTTRGETNYLTSSVPCCFTRLHSVGRGKIFAHKIVNGYFVIHVCMRQRVQWY